MKRLKISELRPGMIIAEDVYNHNKQLVFPKDLVLSDSTITRLEFYTILNIKVADVDNLETPIIDDCEAFSSFSDHIKSSEEFKQFHALFNKSVESFKSSISGMVEKNLPLDTQLLLNEVSELFHVPSSNINIFNMLHNMRQYDDSTFTHSLNVALICMVFSSWLQFSEEDIQTAILCGLLHDLGKLEIPDSIIKKPTKLTPKEFEIIKTHPRRGYNLLKNSSIDPHIINSALMHHEKCDGSGYPFGFTSEKIDPFAKMVAIADVYDATTSARIYRGPLCPFQVIELFEAEGFQKYDTRFILIFLENIAATYMHEHVELSDGSIGEIVFINKNDLARPIVKCNDVFHDLSKEKDLKICKII